MCVKRYLVVYNGKGMTPVCFKIASRFIRPSTCVDKEPFDIHKTITLIGVAWSVMSLQIHLQVTKLK